MKPDVTELWKKICHDDDIKAFESFYYTLFNKLIRFCMYYVEQREPAEEIVSEVFVRCWNNRKSLTHIEFPETYLFVAVKNQSLKHCKKFSGIHLVEIESTHEVHMVDMADPARKLELKELHHRLDTAIDTLPTQSRMVFKMIKENGLKYKEVAEILDISPRTVQTQLFRAIAKLRTLLHADQLPGNKPNHADKLLNLVVFLNFVYYFAVACRHF